MFNVYLFIYMKSEAHHHKSSMLTGAKAIGTAWTIAPSQEEESIWGGKTLTKGIVL